MSFDVRGGFLKSSSDDQRKTSAKYSKLSINYDEENSPLTEELVPLTGGEAAS
jgi:hypothetical protein